MTMQGVERVVPIVRSYKLVSREHQEQTSVVYIGSAPFGRGNIGMIAGPCAIESAEQTVTAAKAVKDAGATVLRGGAFKPRTSPYDFQGLGEEGLKILADAGRQTDLPTVTEAREARHIDLVARYADAIQIGARNMQNYDLLQAAGETGLPIILKRGLSATVEDVYKRQVLHKKPGFRIEIFAIAEMLKKQRGVRALFESYVADADPVIQVVVCLLYTSRCV